MNAELLTDLQVIAFLGYQGVFINMLSIMNLHRCGKELADVFLIIARRNPALTEL